MTTEAPAVAEAAAEIPAAAPSPEQARIVALEQQLAAVETAFLADLPEHLKPLVPAGLPVADRIGWLQNAKKAGLFTQAVSVPTTDSGKAQTTPRDVDLSKLPPAARMAAGYR